MRERLLFAFYLQWTLRYIYLFNNRLQQTRRRFFIILIDLALD